MRSRSHRSAVDLATWPSRTHAVRSLGVRVGRERRRLVASSSEPQERADAPAPEAPGSSPPTSPMSSSSSSVVQEQERPKGHFLAAGSVGFGVALVRLTRLDSLPSLHVRSNRSHSLPLAPTLKSGPSIVFDHARLLWTVVCGTGGGQRAA